MDRHQKQERHDEEAVTGGTGGRRGAMARRGRFDYVDGDRPATAVPVVDQADCTARSCRSCVAVTLADAIALGCCPCALVSLLGLAFVKAPLAAARRCLRRLRRQRVELRGKKRVRDVDPDASKCRRSDADAWRRKGGGEVWADDARRASGASSGRLDAEKVWMEMYRVGQWGFGRLSVSSSVTPPPPPPAPGGNVATKRCSDGDGGTGRKDAALMCEP